MKRDFRFLSFWLLLVFGLATVVFNSCGKDDDGKGDDGKKPAIQVADEKDLTQTVYADETTGAGSVTFTTTGAWSATIPAEAASWLSLSQTNGNKAGEYTITVILVTNTTGADRTGIIVILCDDKEITITITQRGLTADGKKPDAPGSIPVSSISLDSVTLTLVINANYTLKAKVLPANATNPTVAWSSSNTTIATVSSTGLVTALAEGTATITAQAGNESATCGVKVIKALNDPNDPLTDKGVVINGIKWATRNVDAPGKFAAKIEAPGKFYQWNRKTAWSATEPGSGIAIGAAGGWDNTIPAGTTWEPANDPSPAGWRVPTREEQQKLFDASKVRNEWTKINGVFGRKFTDLANEDNFIFLPAACYRSRFDGTLCLAGESGDYWSSTQSGSSYAYYLFFGEWVADWGFDFRSIGYSVRCVAE